MTVQLITSHKEFLGLSSDTKPPLTGIGGKFFETDTGQEYVWNGEEWIEDMRMFNAVKLALEDAR
jgi:hypothetical protein